MSQVQITPDDSSLLDQYAISELDYEQDALLRQQKYILMLTYQMPISVINTATATGLKQLTKYKEL